MRFTVPGLIGLTLIAGLPSVAAPQPRELERGEANLALGYSTCLAFSTPSDVASTPRIALSAEDQAQIPECKKWSTFQRVGQPLDTRDYLPAVAAGQPPLNAFLRHVVKSVYRGPPTTDSTENLYRNFASLGWVEVPPEQSKAGALIVWPGMAGVIVKDASEPAECFLDPLAGLSVVYPSHERRGRLSILDASSLAASLPAGRRGTKPRVMLPISPTSLVARRNACMGLTATPAISTSPPGTVP